MLTNSVRSAPSLSLGEGVSLVCSAKCSGGALDVSEAGAEFRVDVEVALATRPLGSEGISEVTDGALDVAKPGAEFRVEVDVALAARPLGSEGTSEATLMARPLGLLRMSSMTAPFGLSASSASSSSSPLTPTALARFVS